jgi:hypothetical protein
MCGVCFVVRLVVISSLVPDFVPICSFRLSVYRFVALPHLGRKRFRPSRVSTDSKPSAFQWVHIHSSISSKIFESRPRNSNRLEKGRPHPILFVIGSGHKTNTPSIPSIPSSVLHYPLSIIHPSIHRSINHHDYYLDVF